jgi:hypothetical protein
VAHTIGRRALRVPDETVDTPDVPRDLANLATDLQYVATYKHGSTLPSSGMVEGDFFRLTTDLTDGPNGTLYDYDGTAWRSRSGGRAITYGDGSAGDVVISATTLLHDDMYYNNLTVNAAIDTNGFRIFVKNTLTIGAAGIIRRNGNNAGGSTAPGIGLAPASIDGGSGGGGNGGQAGAPGTGAATGGNSADPSLGANGGFGNTSSIGRLGASGGVAPDITFPRVLSPYVDYQSSFSGGAGGGGGGATTTAAGGSGGGGAGVVVIVAAVIINNGIISAIGGNGAASADDATAGGGGGGGGGFILIASTQAVTGTGTISAAGGQGGGTAHRGVNGANGTIVQLVA